MTSNQTPKYQIGQEVYYIHDSEIWKVPILKIQMQQTTDKDGTTIEFLYTIQTPGCRYSGLKENKLYQTPQDIIKDLP